ncbi:MAG: phage virion morphogenesis protein [Synergistaceae bacterium]|jgi:hypothetical protein|nr:phage virion morphogenesis protein [Synergistaceae bacterium]
MSHFEGDWDKIANVLNPAKMRAKLEQAGKRVGLAGVAAVKKGIVSGAPGGQAFTPLSPHTIARKGSSKPLIDHGDLVGSITHENPDLNTVWIGVKKGARGKNGDMANIAAVHEFGCTNENGCAIKVTPKMRAYLHYSGIHLRSATEYIVIPPRPFLASTLNDPEFLDKITKIYALALKEAFFP